jgi:hypothetical protein
MKKVWLRHLTLGALTSAALLAYAAHADLLKASNDNQGNNENRGNVAAEQGTFARIPTGQYVTPVALDDAVQQNLNPHLPAYPDFVAGRPFAHNSARTARRWQ